MKINAGCGTNIKAGYINIDCLYLPGVDIVRSIENVPEIESNSVDEILCNHALEHVQYPARAMKEFHRWLTQDGLLIIRVPHAFTKGAYVWGHKTFFVLESFDWFTNEHFNRCYNSPRFALASRKLVFRGKYTTWLNRLPINPFIIERLIKMLPLEPEIEVILKKI